MKRETGDGKLEREVSSSANVVCAAGNRVPHLWLQLDSILLDCVHAVVDHMNDG